MAASPERIDHKCCEVEVVGTSVRRRRYARSDADVPATLTPIKLQLLQQLFHCRLLSLPQVAALMGLSDQSARRHMRELFDAGLVDRIAVSRAALADPAEPNDASLLYGSAPSIHTVSRKGIDQLITLGLLSRDAHRRPIPVYGPQNALFLRHELMVRDVRVWLQKLVQEVPQSRRVVSWLDGEDAAISLSGGSKAVKPDARFVAQLGLLQTGQPLVLSGLIEADRGTERGSRRWMEKLERYAALFANPTCLTAATGYCYARVLVISSSPARTESIAALLEELLVALKLPPELGERFWLVDRTVLSSVLSGSLAWRIAGVQGVWPLLSSQDER